MDRVRRVAFVLLGPFWVVPALWCLGAVTLGLLIPKLEQGSAGFLPLIFEGGPEGARTVLSTVAGAMISVTGLVFSITIVVLQLASSQFSPRVLRTFLESRITQHTLGVFAASFLYALTVLRAIVDTPGSTVPQVGVTVAYLLVLGAVAMFLAFIHHITRAIAVRNVITLAADETRTLLRRGQTEAADLPSTLAPLPLLGHQAVVVALRSGYLDTIDQHLLCELASRHDARIELRHQLGGFVPEGAPIAVVHGAGAASVDWDAEVARGLGLSRSRTMQQDVSFGFRQLVDIAERALSAGINDPTTAVQVVDELHDLLRRMAGLAESYPVRYDDSGTPRLVLTERTFRDYLDLAVDEIAHYGADDVQVPRRLDAMLVDLEVAARPEHRPEVAAKAADVRRVTKRDS